jgi:hypothetical protein
LLKSEIDEHLVLKHENSPYIAEHDVVINKKANLTIEPGCELRFAKGKQLIVYGTLNARGTHSNRIKFTKLNENHHLSQGNNRHGSKSTLLLNNDNNFRLVEGETVLDGKLQIFYKSKWHYVCSTHFK